VTATACEECDNVHADTRKQHPRQWLCVKFKRLENFSPVAPQTWVNMEPYNRCVNINVGHCPLWTARRNGQQEFTTK
jgi:hypothetical protein